MDEKKRPESVAEWTREKEIDVLLFFSVWFHFPHVGLSPRRKKTLGKVGGDWETLQTHLILFDDLNDLFILFLFNLNALKFVQKRLHAVVVGDLKRVAVRRVRPATRPCNNYTA